LLCSKHIHALQVLDGMQASLTSKAKKKVLILSNQYKIGKNKMSSGVALLKMIIRESHLDTKQEEQAT
jgi:hypothetical protein